MAKVLIVYYSLGGNTKAAAEAVAEGVKAGDADPLTLKELGRQLAAACGR